MTSFKIQCAMIMFYIVLAIFTTIEKNYAKTLYWIGAIILSIGVILMK